MCIPLALNHVITKVLFKKEKKLNLVFHSSINEISSF